MDPITLAVTGALGNLSVKIINDAYEALKIALKHKFGVNSEIVNALSDLEKKPDSVARKGVLKEEVEASHADRDAEIVKAAEALIEAIKSLPDGDKAIKNIVNQNITGNQNIFSGSGNVEIKK